MEQALLQIDKRDRYIFYAHVVDERSFADLALELGMGYKGVAAAYYRVIKKSIRKCEVKKMEFKELLLRAQANDQRAKETLLSLYQPLLMKESIVSGVFDENLYQELCVTLLNCIQHFRIQVGISNGRAGESRPFRLALRREYLIGWYLLRAEWSTELQNYHLYKATYGMVSQKKQQVGWRSSMRRKLVAYFSATGVTAKVAEMLADAIGADIYEIESAMPVFPGRFKLAR